jgi:hypothetical protein
MNRITLTLLLIAVATVAAGCRSGGNVCGKPGLYAQAQSIPSLRIPVGLETPDTRAAMKIPDLNEPQPPPRQKGEGCLDEPPKYTTPTPPKPAPAT